MHFMAGVIKRFAARTAPLWLRGKNYMSSSVQIYFRNYLKKKKKKRLILQMCTVIFRLFIGVMKLSV